MSTIQNFATIVHLHWLRNRYLHASLDELVTQTHSVKYAQLALMQAGYRRNGLARYIAGPQHQETDIGPLMDHFEGGTPAWIAYNNATLARYGFTRATLMRWNFDIEFDVLPL